MTYRRGFVVVLLATCAWGGATMAAGTVPVQGPMLAVDSPIRPSAALGAPQVVSALWNGKEYFAVWNDWRDPQQSNVFGMRVTSMGKVDDPTSLLITPGWNRRRRRL